MNLREGKTENSRRMWGGHYLFELWKQELAVLTKRASDSSDQDQAILVWWDNLSDSVDYFSKLVAPQFVNRVPTSNLLCRKCSFIRLMQRMHALFPDHYNFVPTSYVLPQDEFAFKACTHGIWIQKPDNGSLGDGIKILRPRDNPDPGGSVVQQYIESRLIDGRKFDLRLYVLIATPSPRDDLEIHIYPNGLARFCADSYKSGSAFSQITNTAVNKQKQTNLDDITKMVVPVFGRLAEGGGKSVEELWASIERVVILTVIAALGYLEDGAKKVSHLRPFQVLGFDILLDRHLTPYVLEVNYRPSLSHGTAAETSLKKNMLISALRTVISDDVLASFDELPEFQESVHTWRDFMGNNDQPSEECFRKIYPVNGNDETYKEIVKKSRMLPTTRIDGLPAPPRRYAATARAAPVTGRESRSLNLHKSVSRRT
jgi:hypothetical protein